jgi:transposase
VVAKKLLGENPEYVVLTDQYAGYYSIAQSWGANVAVSKRLETIVNVLFRIRQRVEKGDITEPIYPHPMQRLQRAWRKSLVDGSRLCITPYTAIAAPYD